MFRVQWTNIHAYPVKVGAVLLPHSKLKYTIFFMERNAPGFLPSCKYFTLLLERKCSTFKGNKHHLTLQLI